MHYCGDTAVINVSSAALAVAPAELRRHANRRLQVENAMAPVRRNVHDVTCFLHTLQRRCPATHGGPLSGEESQRTKVCRETGQAVATKEQGALTLRLALAACSLPSATLISVVRSTGPPQAVAAATASGRAPVHSTHRRGSVAAL